MKTFDSEFDVYFEDLSPSGKIHLEKIAEWMSMTREQYFKATCPEHLKFAKSSVVMFTSNISISVLGRSRWADKVKAILTTANIKKISFEMHIDFLNQRTQEIVVQGRQRVVFLNTETQKFTGIPEDMSGVITNYLKPDGKNPRSI